MRRYIYLSVMLAAVFFAGLSYCDEEPVSYETLFDIDLGERHEALWKVFEDDGQDRAKLLENRNIRFIAVGRYDKFSEQFKMESYSQLSVYMSPYQMKILLIDYYFNKLLKMQKIKEEDKAYLTINSFATDYNNLFPHVYKKKRTSTKKSIIPNKIIEIGFFRNEKYIDTYQELFNMITEAVAIKEVKERKIMPKLLDNTSRIKLSESSMFNVYLVDAVVNEVSIKESFFEFLDRMKELTDVVNVTEFYKLQYYPVMGEEFTPLKERRISINVLYDTETDFDYYEMEYAKKLSLIHEYFYLQGLAKQKDSPKLFKGDVIDVMEAFTISMFPDESLFEFDYQQDKGYYYDTLEDFFDNIEDAMDISEEVVSSGEFNLEILKLTATVDEVALIEMMAELKKEIGGYLKK